MAMSEERFARLNEDMARLAQVSDQLAQIVMEMRQVVVLSERRLTLAEERMARHEEQMARHEERMEEIDREAAQTRRMFIRACEQLGLFDDDADLVTPVLVLPHLSGRDFGRPRRRNLEG